MRRWSLTIKFLLAGAAISFFGYLSAEVMFFPGAIVLWPTFPILKLLNWELALEFYHSGNPVDHFGMIKVVLIGTVELGLVGWCLELIKHRKVNSKK